MTMKRWNGSAWIDLTTAKRWTGSAWVDLSAAKRWTGSAWVDIPLPGGGGGPDLSAFVSPGYAHAFVQVISGPVAKTLTTNSVTVTASGGAGAGPTYAWSQLSGSSGITINSPNAATTTFSATLTKNSVRSGQFVCTVTRGVQTVYVVVDVYLEYVVGSAP